MLDDPRMLLDIARDQRARAQHAAALQSFEQLLSIDPHHSDACLGAAASAHAIGNPQRAIAPCRQLLKQEPHQHLARLMLADALRLTGQPRDALNEYRHLLASADSQVDIAAVLDGAGCAAQRLDEYQQATEFFLEALQHRQRDPGIWLNLAMSLQYQLRLDEADYACQQALSIDPHRGGARLQRAVLAFLRGNFQRAWLLYEGRLQNRSHVPRPRAARWNGQRVDRLLLVAEQGYGDSLMMARFVPICAQYCRELQIANLPRALHRLFAQAFPNIQLYEPRAPLPATDAWLPLMSLPLALDLREPDLARNAHWLNPARSAASEQQPLRTIGLVWRGSPTHGNDHRRSINLEQLRPILELPQYQWLCLQPLTPDMHREVRELPPELQARLHCPELADFADTTRTIDECDLVISVDTSVAHLCGALGRSDWVLLPRIPDWRWTLEQPHSPWYPRLQLWRSTEPGWKRLVDRLHQALAQ